jgi:hypothetical protein
VLWVWTWGFFAASCGESVLEAEEVS